MRKAACLLATLGLLVTFAVTAEEIVFPQLDQSALKAMSTEERRAHQQAYKAQLEEIARTHGWTREMGLAAFGPPGERKAPPEKRLKIPGTSISYHAGATIPASTIPVTNGFCVGNQFDTALNPPGTACCFPVEASGSLTMASFSLSSIGGTAVFFSLFDQLAGATANNITTFNTAGLGAGANAITVALNYVGSSFIAGVWNFNSDNVAVATGTAGGQGFHAVSLDDINGMSFMTIPSHNVTVSVAGNVATPVELQNFTID